MKKLILIFLISGSFIFLGCNQMENNSTETKENQETITLPEPALQGSLTLEETLQQRRSIREYTEEAISIEDISQILWAAQGTTNQEKRTAPSAGATYPIEIYIAVNKAEELEPGIYYYNNYKHHLKKVSKGKPWEKLSNAALNQEPIKNATANIILTAEFERTTERYWSRGYQYVYMEAGHISQNIYLQAESLNIGTVAIGAFEEEDIKDILWVDDYEPVYIMPIWYK